MNDVAGFSNSIELLLRRTLVRLVRYSAFVSCGERNDAAVAAFVASLRSLRETDQQNYQTYKSATQQKLNRVASAGNKNNKL